jgi:zinc/manganese transport system permease protein
MDALTILFAPAILLALMVISHTYFGLHVLERGIIFVDLAVAQIAALGMSIAFMAGIDPHGLTSQLIALSATLIAAFGLAFLRRARDKTTREVAIGCSYVIATAAAIVILSRTNQGMEELKGMLNGNVLWVQWKEVVLLFVIYALLAVLHVAFFQKFLNLSSRSESAKGHFVWEFLFFSSFAVVITLAVNLAGVLLVFASLIIPAFSASFLSGSFKSRLLLGWLLGLIAAIGGLIVSYFADLPTGSAVVCAIGVLPVVALALRAAFGINQKETREGFV